MEGISILWEERMSNNDRNFMWRSRRRIPATLCTVRASNSSHRNASVESASTAALALCRAWPFAVDVVIESRGLVVKRKLAHECLWFGRRIFDYGLDCPLLGLFRNCLRGMLVLFLSLGPRLNVAGC